MILVSRTGSALTKSVRDFRRCRGATTKEYRVYFEEEQRRQRRKEPANLSTNFRFGTLGPAFEGQANSEAEEHDPANPLEPSPHRGSQQEPAGLIHRPAHADQPRDALDIVDRR